MAKSNKAPKVDEFEYINISTSHSIALLTELATCEDKYKRVQWMAKLNEAVYKYRESKCNVDLYPLPKFGDIDWFEVEEDPYGNLTKETGEIINDTIKIEAFDMQAMSLHLGMENDDLERGMELSFCIQKLKAILENNESYFAWLKDKKSREPFLVWLEEKKKLQGSQGL